MDQTKLNVGNLLSVDFDEPEAGKMVLHIATKSGGVCAGNVYWTTESLFDAEREKYKKQIESMRVALIAVLENDEVCEGFNNNNLSSELKQQIRDAIPWKV